MLTTFRFAGRTARRPLAGRAMAACVMAVLTFGAPTVAAKKRRTSNLEVLLQRSPDSLLNEAQRLYDALEYDRVIPLASAVLAHEDSTVDQQLDAYLLQGSAFAVVGDPIEAETPFRFLLRGRPDFDLPPTTPPKILAVFRKVQVEEQAIVQTTRALERQRIIRNLTLETQLPSTSVGGQPLPFEVTLRDPRGAVASVRAVYRLEGETAWSALALQPQGAGEWTSIIPGATTANTDGMVLEVYFTTADVDGGELLIDGSEKRPYRIEISPGDVATTASAFYQSPWFWGAGAVVVVAVAASIGGVALIASLPPQGDLGILPLE